MSARMRASVVIPVFNRRVDLAECLSALAADGLTASNAEVVVVDDGSADGVERMMASDFPHVCFLKTGGNHGPAHARNRGAAVSTGALLLFLDSDAVPQAGWLAHMLAGDDGNTILVGCTLDYRTGRVQFGPRRASFIGKSLPCRAHRVTTGPSCNLGVPRAVFERIGGFNEAIPYYFEDSFLCIQARRSGARFLYLDTAVVKHKGSALRRGDAVRMQEHNSTYAMLEFYRGSPGRKALFTLLNGIWLVFRLITWPFCGRFSDAARLFRGWSSAYLRHYGGCRETQPVR